MEIVTEVELGDRAHDLGWKRVDRPDQVDKYDRRSCGRRRR